MRSWTFTTRKTEFLTTCASIVSRATYPSPSIIIQMLKLFFASCKEISLSYNTCWLIAQVNITNIWECPLLHNPHFAYTTVFKWCLQKIEVPTSSFQHLISKRLAATYFRNQTLREKKRKTSNGHLITQLKSQETRNFTI